MIRNNDGTWILTDNEMNTVSLYLIEAYESYCRRGRDAIGADAEKIASIIYEKLAIAGYYVI